MIRITTHATDTQVVLTLEGCLSGPWVAEADASWRDALAVLNERQIRVDLTSICHVDMAGRDLLTIMYLAGAHFVARGCVMPEVVREISGSAEAMSGHRS